MRRDLLIEGCHYPDYCFVIWLLKIMSFQRGHNFDLYGKLAAHALWPIEHFYGPKEWITNHHTKLPGLHEEARVPPFGATAALPLAHNRPIASAPPTGANRNLNHLKKGTAGRIFFTHNVYFKGPYL